MVGSLSSPLWNHVILSPMLMPGTNLPRDFTVEKRMEANLPGGMPLTGQAHMATETGPAL